MDKVDSRFTDEIASLYDRCLRPLLFEPYAEDLARRAAALRPKRVLETAAGTGAVTEKLLAALPDAEIVATDVNPAMLALAEARLGSGRAAFRPADAQQLPFPDGRFDLVLCQFGVMFFPDRVGGYREARRVLAAGGTFLFNAWGPLEDNGASAVVAETVALGFGRDPPSFFQRVPFGYHDPGRVEAELRAAGFTDIAWETVRKRSRGPTAREVAAGLCLGTPLRSEIEARDPARMDSLIEAAAAALAPYVTASGLDAPMSANVFTAS